MKLVVYYRGKGIIWSYMMALKALVRKWYTSFSPHYTNQSKSHDKPDISRVEKYNSLAGRDREEKTTNNF